MINDPQCLILATLGPDLKLKSLLASWAKKGYYFLQESTAHTQPNSIQPPS